MITSWYHYQKISLNFILEILSKNALSLSRMVKEAGMPSALFVFLIAFDPNYPIRNITVLHIGQVAMLVLNKINFKCVFCVISLLLSSFCYVCPLSVITNWYAVYDCSECSITFYRYVYCMSQILYFTTFRISRHGSTKANFCSLCSILFSADLKVCHGLRVTLDGYIARRGTSHLIFCLE